MNGQIANSSRNPAATTVRVRSKVATGSAAPGALSVHTSRSLLGPSRTRPTSWVVRSGSMRHRERARTSSTKSPATSVDSIEPPGSVTRAAPPPVMLRLSVAMVRDIAVARGLSP